MYQIWHATIILFLNSFFYLHVQRLLNDGDDAVEIGSVKVSGEALGHVVSSEAHMIVSAECVEHIGEGRVYEMELMSSPGCRVEVGFSVQSWRAFSISERGGHACPQGNGCAAGACGVETGSTFKDSQACASIRLFHLQMRADVADDVVIVSDGEGMPGIVTDGEVGFARHLHFAAVVRIGQRGVGSQRHHRAVGQTIDLLCGLGGERCR